MSFTSEVNADIYRQMAELQEKLRKSEEERMKLEEKFRFLMKSCREEEENRLRNLQDRYAKFLEDCTKRNDRNDKILKSLEKVESGANVVFAKTERLKLLRSHYEAYLDRVMPRWKDQFSITYKPNYSSSLQQPSFRPTVTSRLTSSSSDYLSNYSLKYPTPETSGIRPPSPDARSHLRTFEENDRKPILRERSFSTTNFADLTGKHPSLERRDSQFTLRDNSFEDVPSLKAEQDFLEKKRERRLSFHEKVFALTQSREDLIVEPLKPAEPVEVEPVMPVEIIKYAAEPEKLLKSPVEKLYKPDNPEIECLTEDFAVVKPAIVDLNLSDDEVLDNLTITERRPSIGVPKSVPKPEVSIGKLPTDITLKFEAPNKFPWSQDRADRRPSISNRRSIDIEEGERKLVSDEILNEVSPMTKRSVIDHQKSIDKLRAVLSVEEESDAEKKDQAPKEEEAQRLEEETDVTESSSEVWRPTEDTPPPADWYQAPSEPAILSDVDEIENEFAGIVEKEQAYQMEKPPYENEGHPYTGEDQLYPVEQQPYPVGQPPYEIDQPPYEGGEPPYDMNQHPYQGDEPPYQGDEHQYQMVGRPYPEAQLPFEGEQELYPDGEPPSGYYEENQNIGDYNEETYPESYYEQPQQQPQHYPTNIASNVILEEDEYEAEPDNQDQIYQRNQQFEQNPEAYQYEQYQDYPQPEGVYDEDQGQYIPENEYVPREYVEQVPFQGEGNYVEQEYQGEYQGIPPEYTGEYREDVGQYQHEDGGPYEQEGVQYQEGKPYPQEMPEYQQESGQQDKIFPPEEQLEQNEAAFHPTQPVLSHLLESESESYQVEHGSAPGNEDSDFDFSMSQK